MTPHTPHSPKFLQNFKYCQKARPSHLFPSKKLKSIDDDSSIDHIINQ